MCKVNDLLHVAGVQRSITDGKAREEANYAVVNSVPLSCYFYMLRITYRARQAVHRYGTRISRLHEGGCAAQFGGKQSFFVFFLLNTNWSYFS